MKPDNEFDIYRDDDDPAAMLKGMCASLAILFGLIAAVMLVVRFLI